MVQHFSNPDMMYKLFKAVMEKYDQKEEENVKKKEACLVSRDRDPRRLPARDPVEYRRQQELYRIHSVMRDNNQEHHPTHPSNHSPVAFISTERCSSPNRCPTFKARSRSPKHCSSSERCRSPKRRSSPPTRSRSPECYSPGRCRFPNSESSKREPVRRKPSKFWDVAPLHCEDMTPLQFKAQFKPNLYSETLASVSKSFVVNAKDIPLELVPASVGGQSRKLWVGNIPFGVTEEEMMDFFNQSMEKYHLSLAPGNSVLSVHTNDVKCYMFLDFRSIDETTQAMALDGVPFKGLQLKIRRPRDYKLGITDPPSLFSYPIVKEDSDANKLFIGGIPHFLNSDQVTELISTFGKLRTFNLVKDVSNSTGSAKCYAFCEYVDKKATDLAIVGLNGMQLGDMKLIVQRASVRAKNALFSGETSTLRTPDTVQVQVPGLSASDFKSEKPTEVLCLMNMVTPEELEDDEEFEDILADIRDECKKFGQVVSIEIPRPISGVDVPGVSKVFVEFTSPQECQNAYQHLAGRRFSKRVVVISYFSLEKYHKLDF